MATEQSARLDEFFHLGHWELTRDYIGFWPKDISPVDGLHGVADGNKSNATYRILLQKMGLPSDFPTVKPNAPKVQEEEEKSRPNEEQLGESEEESDMEEEEEE